MLHHVDSPDDSLGNLHRETHSHMVSDNGPVFAVYGDIGAGLNHDDEA